jgi:hypothetical protein
LDFGIEKAAAEIHCQWRWCRKRLKKTNEDEKIFVKGFLEKVEAWDKTRPLNCSKI